MKVGDAVYVMFGSQMPFILRPTEADQSARCHHEYVEHAYVHGMDHGRRAGQGGP